MIGDKLTQLLDIKGIKPGTLARETGIPKSTIYSIIKRNNKNVDYSVIETISEYLCVPVEYFFDNSCCTPELDAFGKNMSKDANLYVMPRMRQWPVLGATACGEPLHRELEETVIAPDDINADFVFRCVGDSMIGARILDGDAVFVKQGVDVLDGQIAVVRVGDEYTLKRIYKGSDYLELRSENPAYPPIILRGEDLDAEIVGKAVQFLSRVI